MSSKVFLWSHCNPTLVGFWGKNFMLSKSFDKFYFKNELNLMLGLGKAFIIAGGWLGENWEWKHTPGSSFAQDKGMLRRDTKEEDLHHPQHRTWDHVERLLSQYTHVRWVWERKYWWFTRGLQCQRFPAMSQQRGLAPGFVDLGPWPFFTLSLGTGLILNRHSINLMWTHSLHISLGNPFARKRTFHIEGHN